MRVLITVPPAFAHINPVIPLAGALRGAGHDVCFATHPEMTEVIRDLGFFVVPVGGEGFGKVQLPGSEALYDRIVEVLAGELSEGSGPGGESPHRLPTKPVFETFTNYCSDRPTAEGAGLMADELVEFARGWQPDLVLWDTVAFPGAVAAAACGAAHARLVWGMDDFGWTRQRLSEQRRRPGAPADADPMAEMMRPLLRRHGLEFHDELLVGQWVMDNFPAIGLRAPLDLPYLYSRPVPFNGSGVVPDWLYARSGRRRVALSLGAGMRSFYPADSVIDLDALFEAAVKLDVEMVATLNSVQLESVRNVPENVRVIDYLPLNLLLPTCSALVHHGGGGTFGAAVAYRVPQLVWPEESQYYEDIARYVHRSGAGLAVDREDDSPGTVTGQLAGLLDDPAFADGTEALHRNMLTVPSPTDVVPALERLTAQYRGNARHR
ncbi:nucleotide disphospho-sugar-binding domain-containing protein [Streptomyces sp. HNM0574]|uniref:nucleotide disphospho-sugar-binding domain-containing protein n=1 Tax=Streptomyces sp. HNM0574 TaxID=2714954 RepID=UPI00146DBFB8|nr:nucleotide disphospho-sugar-binding domain-containing protein [Streptomyces sp. HNM0574]NLU68545.1 DUF1205 domain-containing protein [Streptomyces sp. HNM0574]